MIITIKIIQSFLFILITYTYSLITSRLFSKLRFVTLGACSLPTLFPTNQPSFATPKRWLKSLFLPSTVPNQDSQLTLSMLKRCVSQHTQFISSSSDLTDIIFFIYSGEILADGGQRTVLFAEATTCQLEFKYLAKLTGKKEYYERVGFYFYFYFFKG